MYKDYFPKGIQACTYNLRIVKENEGISVFDNAFNTTSPDFILGDGQPLCSNAHPTVNSTFTNLITPAELNETSIEAMIMVSQNFIDGSGQRVMIQAKKYLVGIPNQFIVNILTGSNFQPGSANNAVNPLVYGDYLDNGFIVSHYMINTLNFFLLTDYNDGLVHYMRQPIEIEMSTDQTNQNLGVYANERYRFRPTNGRSVVGCQGN